MRFPELFCSLYVDAVRKPPKNWGAFTWTAEALPGISFAQPHAPATGYKAAAFSKSTGPNSKSPPSTMRLR